MIIAEDRWLADVVGQPVFRVEVDESDHAGSDLAREVLDHSAQQPAAFYYARVPTAAIATVRALAPSGFYVVDVSVTFGLPTSRVVPPSPSSAVAVAVARPEQHAHILDIAERCFRYSRFHLDPAVPRTTADRIKREWIASYVAGRRGERLLAATLEGEPVGFLAVLASASPGKVRRVIDLVGVRPEAQGLGVGTALVEAFVAAAAPTSDVLEVGTQVANVPSLRLYRRCGFEIVRSAYVLHMHVRRGS